MAMIEVEHLSKRYGGNVAVQDISFSVQKGEIVGFLGRNGAGKSTTMRILTGSLGASPNDRVLATVLFLDIVGATELATRLGDRRWGDLLAAHLKAAREELARLRGREIDTAGDGLFAAFDGPARAIRCARALREGARRLGLTVRIGVHTGECEVMGEKLGGIAVHIGARVGAAAQADEILVTGTVRDLVAGSGLRFEDRGSHPLKGVPGEWRLFALAAPVAGSITG